MCSLQYLRCGIFINRQLNSLLENYITLCKIAIDVKLIRYVLIFVVYMSENYFKLQLL